jgi:CRISPR-associated protein Csx16
MTIWFISRHPGALEWMHKHGVAYDRHVPHVDPADIQPGDTVIGSLPVNLAAEVCARGAKYRHLSLELNAGDRGRELSADELDCYKARIENFSITRLE